MITPEGRVRLWTRQHEKCLDQLKKEGLIRINRTHLEEKFEEISPYIIPLYEWFVEVANTRVKKPAGVSFPMWCSISEENMLRPVPGQVVLVLEVDADEVVYFDGQKWDYVLNHHYIAKDEEDAKAYREDLEAKGFKNGFSFIDSKVAHLYPSEKERVMASWHRVFEIEDWNLFNVQANLWEIRPEMVKEILYFEA